jgi:hypothetical protein
VTVNTVETTWSELLQQPNKTLDKLRGHRALLVHRRDAEDLVVTTVSKAEEASEVRSATTRMFIVLMQRDARARELVTEVLPAAFPWVRYLPAEGLRAFVLELVEELERADSLENPAPVAHLLAAWRATAESYADPEYMAALREVGQDLGPVPEPEIP